MTRMLERVGRACSIACALSTLLPGCGGADAPPPGAPLPVRVMIQPYLGNAPILIAHEEGYFAEQGLAVELITMNAVDMAVPLLINGELDVIAGAAAPGILNAIQRGAAVRAVAERGSYARDGCTRLAILTRPGLLTGHGNGNGPPPIRRISLNSLAPMLYAVDRVLGSANVDVDTLESVQIPDAAEIEALLEGRIDAAFTGEPWLTRALERGAGEIWLRTEDVLPGEAYAFNFFGPSFLEQNREAGERWMAAYLKGVRRFREGRTPETVELLARATGEDPAMLARMCWPTFTEDGRVDLAALESYRVWAVEKGYVDPVNNGFPLWDGSFIEAALGRIGNSPHD